MVHPIEEKIATFLKNSGKPNRVLVDEFKDKIGSQLMDKFYKEDTKPSPFSIRMSNIGLPLRQLCLQRDYGRVSHINADGTVKAFTLHSFYGQMLEGLMLFLLKASGVNIIAENKKVLLPINGHTIPGELDLIIDGAVWDVKTASDYSYTYKFESYEVLEADDPFGYMAQGFGYAMAENLPFGGWIVINKSKGVFKVVSVPLSVQRFYKEKYYREFDDKIRHITSGLPAPRCTGVIPEYFRRKDTGNKILGKGCEWCDYKEICHPHVVEMPSLVSEAKDKPVKYYIKIDPKYQGKK